MQAAKKLIMNHAGELMDMKNDATNEYSGQKFLDIGDAICAKYPPPHAGFASALRLAHSLTLTMLGIGMHCCLKVPHCTQRLSNSTHDEHHIWMVCAHFKR